MPLKKGRTQITARVEENAKAVIEKEASEKKWSFSLMVEHLILIGLKEYQDQKSREAV